MKLSSKSTEKSKSFLLKYIPVTWDKALISDYDEPYFLQLEKNIAKEYKEHKKQIFPPKEEVFRALRLTPLSSVKIVIIGQDPYHREGQANGLAFSVRRGKRIPPSLRNIFKEAGISKPQSGDLTPWAEQGVLLLNSILTVREGQPLSHESMGWEELTSAILAAVCKELRPRVFILWGKRAKLFRPLITRYSRGHFLLEASHPAASCYSNTSDFEGCNHFARANRYLQERGIEPIDWNINNEFNSENKETCKPL